MKNNAELALQFNNCINNQNIEGLAALMTHNHVFIDSADNITQGKENSIANWKKFFKIFPFYRNIFEKVIVKNSTVIMQGYSLCSDEVLNNVKAIWTSKIHNYKVKEWRVYSDTKENRSNLSL